jgi:CheY-like chemotaxis protein
VKHGILFLALVSSVVAVGSAKGQPSEFYKQPTNVDEYWKALQFEIAVGSFDIAARHISGLLALNPTEKDLLALEAKYSLAAMLRLRNVQRWSPDINSREKMKRDAAIAFDKEARTNVEKLIQLTSDALKKELSNPERITRFAKALVAPIPEEAAFAQKELLRSGSDAIPVLLDILQQSPPSDQRAAILELLPKYEVVVVPQLIAALDTSELNLRMDLLKMLRRRSDYTSLQNSVETDIKPNLWFYTAPIPGHAEELRTLAREMLIGLLSRHPDVDRDSERRLPQYQLVQITLQFLNHKARFTTPGNVAVWKWTANKAVVQQMNTSEAEEYYGLRYARWALTIQPDYAPAQKAFITLALDKHHGRTGGSAEPLAKSSPGLHAALAAAPYDLIADLLQTALDESRVNMAVSLIQILGERTEVRAVRTSEKPVGGTTEKPLLRASLLQRALDHSDRRIQFAAVDALLRTPSPQGQERAAQIVKVLANTLEGGENPGGKPKAMIGDPDRVRGEALGSIMRQVGFEVEVKRVGKDLMRRLQEKADFDLIVLDQHIPGPMLPDLLAQLRADYRTKGIPLMIVASPNTPTTAHPITLLARLAAVVAAEEHIGFEKAVRRDPNDPSLDLLSLRFSGRLDRLKQLVESAGVTVSADVVDRLEYLVYLTTAPEAMGLPEDLEMHRLVIPNRERRSRMLELTTGQGRGRIAAEEPPFSFSREKTPALAEVLARYEAAQKRELLDLADVYWRILQYGQQDKAGVRVQESIPAVAIRYPEIEGRLKHLTVGYKKVRVIPEVFTDYALRDELNDFASFQDPKIAATEKAKNAQVALEWLRKMALGELSGYPWADAEAALRHALQRPEHALLAIDAVERLSSKEAQQDLASVLLSNLDAPIRARAGDALIRHIQQRGLMTSAPQRKLILDLATTETDPAVRIRVLALKGILDADAKAIGKGLIGYTPAPAPAPAPKEP